MGLQACRAERQGVNKRAQRISLREAYIPGLYKKQALYNPGSRIF
jgi:hypothetical protein